MAKFNTSTSPRVTAAAASAIRTLDARHAARVTNHQGGTGVLRDPHSELFTLAVNAIDITADTFYEKGGTGTPADPDRSTRRIYGSTPPPNPRERIERLRELTATVAVADPAWIAEMIPYLRHTENLRTVPLVMAAETVHAWVANGIPGGTKLIERVLVRADEPGELIAYWRMRFGRNLPKPIKRGVLNAILRLYTQRSLLKYDTASHAYRFADVLAIVRPNPAANLPAFTPDEASAPVDADEMQVWLDRERYVHEQRNARTVETRTALYGYAQARRHNDAEFDLDGSVLSMVFHNSLLRQEAAVRPEVLLDAERLRAAGFTWEDALSLAGNRVDKAALWEALIPVMGAMAIVRNLRNFEQAGISDEAADKVNAILADPEQILRSRQLPFRFLSAFQALKKIGSLRYLHGLDRALNHSLPNIPELPGRTLVLVDRSGSMFQRFNDKTELSYADSAAIFGAAIAKRNLGRADLIQYGTTAEQIGVQPGTGLLTMLERFKNLGGTYTAAAIRKYYSGHDRVIVVTDEQHGGGFGYHYSGGGDPAAEVPAHIPLYTWNLAGYRTAQTASGSTRHTFAGLTDRAFSEITRLEAGKGGTWPWQQ